MKKLIALLLALVMVFGLVACGASEPAPEAPKAEDPKVETPKEEALSDKKEEVVLHMMLTGAGQWEKHLQPIVDKYYEQTGVKVEFECYEHTNYFPAMEAKMSAKSSDVDIIGVDVPMTSGYAEKGYVVPMDDYFTADELNEFVPAAVSAGSWKGNFYAAAMNTSAQALYYNTTLLAQAGIEIPAADPNNRLTWEEVVEMAEKALKVVDPDGTNGINGIIFEQSNTAYQMLSLPNSLGEKSIGDDGFTVDGIINTDGWVEAMTFYGDLFENGLSPRGLTSTENQATFLAGKTLFMVGGIWCANLEYADGFEWNYTYCPTFEGHEDTVATPTGSWHLGVSAYSEKQAEAAAFVKYLTLGEGNDMWLASNGDIPARTAVVDKYMTDPAYAEYPLSIQRIAAYEAANTAAPRPVTPAYAEYESILNATMSDIANGADPAEALADCVDQANALMAKYK